MSAGAGEMVRQAGLPPEALERVVITTSSGVHAVPLAEYSILGLLAVAKELPQFVEDQRKMAWPEVRRPLRELSGQTLFLVGLGEIGREVARLGKALGMRTVGFRRTEGPPPTWVDEVHSPQRLAELAGRADAIVVSLPLTEQTTGLVDRATIERLPASCIFVNVGRGGVVDEPALIDGLRERRIAGAVLDVFATEPLPEDSPRGRCRTCSSPRTPARSPSGRTNASSTCSSTTCAATWTAGRPQGRRARRVLLRRDQLSGSAPPGTCRAANRSRTSIWRMRSLTTRAPWPASKRSSSNGLPSPVRRSA